MFELKPLSPAAITAALAKAERYRLLNEPEQCESICEDILRTDPDNHGARIALILAITDSFPRTTRAAVRATDLVAALPSEYDRCYYGGLVAERPRPGSSRRWPTTNVPTPSVRLNMTTRGCGGTPAHGCSTPIPICWRKTTSRARRSCSNKKSVARLGGQLGDEPAHESTV